jgi:HEAT repeat protein
MSQRSSDKPEGSNGNAAAVLDRSSAEAGGGRVPWVPLVLMPLLMVTAFVLVIVLFGWLGVAGDDPAELVARLQRADRTGFRDAVTLVQMLREPAGEHLRRDQRLARELARLLQDELAAGRMDADRIQLRSFLCRALGEFERDEVLGPLLEAAGTERDVREIDVRRSALEAIAQFVADRPRASATVDDRLLQTLLAASYRPASDEAPQAARDAQRATAAFALGVLDHPEAHARLVVLLDDLSEDVRYNAAAGLARWGRAESAPVLLEMLDGQQASLLDVQANPRQRRWRRQIVARSALRSVELLWAAEASLDWDPLRAAVQRLARDPHDLNIQHQARRTMQALEASVRADYND